MPERSPPSTSPVDASSPCCLFAAGEVVGERYEVLRFIARGSVGEVYEAKDLALGLSIALKVIALKVAGDTHVKRRFEREILMARQINHPNVCRIFDLGVHREPPDFGGEELVFLTMELLAGETLAQRIRRAGPLGPDEVLAIAPQLAAGLTAAHQAGVVHRDFKSSNVLLVASGAKERAVIADFGLARVVAESESSVTDLTREGTIVGTPAYMSPEQATGRRVTAAADLYAFGVVLYEMVTGRRPFVAERPLDVVAQRLEMTPPRPSRFAPDLELRWEQTILRCLEREPRDRFASPLEVAQALAGDRIPPSPRRLQRRRLTLAAMASLMVVAVLVLGLLWHQRSAQSRQRPVGTAVTAPQRLALLGFRNLDGNPDTDWMGPLISEELTSALDRAGFEVVTGEKVSRARQQLQVELGEVLAADTIYALSLLLDTDHILFGSYLVIAGTDGRQQVRLHLRLQDIDGKLTPLVEQGRADEVVPMLHRAVRRLREALAEQVR